MTRRRGIIRKSIFHRLLTRLLYVLIIPLGIYASETVTISFRDSACVNDTVITLGDITTAINAPTPELKLKLAATPVGASAPAGFARFLTSDDAIAYFLRPSFPGVSFTAEEHKRLHIATDFKEHTLVEYESEIIAAAYKSVAWKQDECTIRLVNGDKSWRCLNKPFSIVVQRPEGDKCPKGNSAMKLRVTQGARQSSVPVVVKIKVELPVLVAKTRISRDAQLSAENCELKKTDITELKYEAYSDIAALASMRAARMLAPGTVLHENLVKKIPVVQRGDEVFIHVSEGGVIVAVKGFARQDGARGDKILVENAATHKLLHARIKTRGNVFLISTRESL